mgnify:CR=1 FL=1|tara:strand:- start:145 stop:321 length:177 start_codon:yes stop_codon:yes gene_type:complete
MSKGDTFSIERLKKLLNDLKDERHCGQVELKINMFDGGVTSVQLKTGFSYKKLILEDN